MSGRDPFDTRALAPLAPALGLRSGELMALADGGATALVHDPCGPDSTFLRARTTVDLHADHIGRQVLVGFVTGIAEGPVVVGVLRDSRSARGRESGPLSIDADGERLVVDGKRQLVLRCGKASITLTHAGKVLIDGTYVLSRSTGANRIKGGSVQLN